MFLGDTNCPIIIPDNPLKDLSDIEKSTIMYLMYIL